MSDISKRADSLRIIGELIEAAEPIAAQGAVVDEYAVPAENYEALVALFAELQGREII